MRNGHDAYYGDFTKETARGNARFRFDNFLAFIAIIAIEFRSGIRFLEAVKSLMNLALFCRNRTTL
jgi:hypothetical protein